MPNELYTPANLVGGLSSDSFAIDIDTKERAAAILSTIPKNDLYAPAPPPSKNFVDKNSSIQDLLISNQDYLDAALKSDDAELFNLAWDINNRRIAKDVQRTANLLPTGFVKEDWMDRYLDDDIGVDLTKSAQENEQRFRDVYWDTKSWFGKGLYGTTAFVSNVTQGVISKTIASAGYLWELIEGGIRNIGDIATGRDDHNMFASMADNSLIRAMEHWDENHKNSFLPMYKSIDYDNKGFFSKFFTGNFWTDEVADGLAFLGSVAIPGMGIAKGAQAITKGASVFSKTTQAGRNASKALEFFTGTDNIGGLATYMYNTGIEASIEAAEGFKSIKADLLKRNPGMTDEEATRQAGNQAKDIFLTNIGILSASNMWEQRMIFSPLFKRAFKGHTANNFSLVPGSGSKLKGYTQKGLNFEKKAPTNWFKSIYTDPYSATSFYGKRLIGGLIAEGLWEENAQLAATRSASGTYERNDGTGSVEVESDDNFFKQYFKQTADIFSGNDIEGSTSVGLGGIIGSTSLAISRLRNYDVYDPVNRKNEKVKGELNARIRQNQLHADYINNAATDFLNSYNPVWDKNEKGEYVINTDAAKKVREAQAKSAEDLLKIENVIDQIDKPEIQESLRRALLSKYLYALESIGDTDRFYKSLDLYSEQSKEKLAELGLDKDNQKVAAEDVKNNLTLFKNIRDKVFNTAYSVIQKSITTDEETITYTPTELEARKLRLANTLYDLHTRQIIMQPVIDANESIGSEVKSSFQEGIREVYDRVLRESADTASSTPESVEEINNLVQTADRRLKYEELSAQEQVIEDIVKEAAINEEYKKSLQNELSIIKKEKEALESLGIDYSPKYKDEASGKEGDMMEDYRKIRYQIDSAKMSLGYASFLIDRLSDPANALQNLHDYEVFDEDLKMKTLLDNTLTKYIAAYKVDKSLPQGMTIETFIEFLEANKDKLSEEHIKFLEELKAERLTPPVEEVPEKPESPAVIPTNAVQRAQEVVDAVISRMDNGEISGYPLVKFVLKSNQSLEKKVEKLLQNRNILKEEEVQDLEAFLPSQTTVLDKLLNDQLDLGSFTIEKFEELLKAVENNETDFSAFMSIEGYETMKNIVNFLVKEPNKNIYDKAYDKIVSLLPSEKGEKKSSSSLKPPVAELNASVIIKSFDESLSESFLELIESFVGEGMSRKDATDTAWASLTPEKKENAVIKLLTDRNNLTQEQASALLNSWKEDPVINNELQRLFSEINFNFQINRPAEEEQQAEDPITPEPVITPKIFGIEEAFRLAQDAIENERTFTEQRREEGIDFEDNEIDQAVDTSKENGNITLVTRIPSDIYNVENNVPGKPSHRRRMFLDNINDGVLNKEDYKLRVYKEGRDFKAILVDKEENIVYIDDKGLPGSKGTALVFLIELDKTHYKNTLFLRRSQAFKRKNFKGPLTIHENYKVYENPGRSFVDDFTTAVNAGNVFASIDFITNGVVYQGETKDTVNPTNRNPIPKHSLKDLLGKDHVVNTLIFRKEGGEGYRPNTINFRLKRDLSDPNSKTDIYQFRPVTLKGATIKGKSLIDSLPKYKNKNGKELNFFEALSLGIIPTTEESVKELFYLLVNPSEFSILSVDNYYKVVSNDSINILMNKISKGEELSTQDVLNLSKSDYDLMINRALNISKEYYIDNYNKETKKDMPISLKKHLGIKNIEEFLDMINENLKGSYEVFAGKGYAKINKRIIFTIDKSLGDIMRENNKKDIISVNTETEKVDSTSVAENLSYLLTDNVEEVGDESGYIKKVVNIYKEKGC